MKKLNDVYKEVEEKKSNTPKEKGTYSMPLDAFFKEHLTLVKVLREGSREELLAEAEKQEEELEHCLEKHNMTMEDIEEDENE